MNADSIRLLLRAQPFEPFELHMSNGEVVPVRHPELAWLIGARLYVHVSELKGEVTCSLLHINTIRKLQPAA